jgi:hypothetical protein|tara:strand:- start:1711 stop:1887 length:177 start_codon:yes stop_codon:yes gene_type:complete
LGDWKALISRYQLSSKQKKMARCTLDEQEIQKVKVDLESLFSLKEGLIGIMKDIKFLN